MMKFFFRTSPPRNKSSLLNPLAKTQPNFLSPSRWRFNKQWDTVEIIEDTEKREALFGHAYDNLVRWREESTETPPQTIQVLPEDWGIATFDATRKYGSIFPVLNMASATYVGGAWHQGGSAQEENMFMRTTLPLEILRGMQKGYIYYNESEKAFMYNEEMNKRVDFEGYLNTRYPHVCFKSPDIRLPNDTFTEDPSRKGEYISDPGSSFEPLLKEHVFPFHDFRFAALDLSRRKCDWSDESFLKQYRGDLRQQTDALLDKLIKEGETSAILGGIGTGAYRHPAKEVAESFRQSFEERADMFNEIVFPLPIFGRDSTNHDAFKSILDGVKLHGPKSFPELPTREEFMAGAENPFVAEVEQAKETSEEKPSPRS